jgi:uncharacterized protein YtpQ (UPF0354 family)
MKRLLQFVLAALGICSGCSKSPVLTPSQFTNEFAKVLRASSPGLKVEVVAELHVHVTYPDGHEWTSFLHNAYDVYKLDPSAPTEAIQRFIASFKTEPDSHDEIDPACIIPVVKDRAWLEETHQALLDSGAKKVLNQVWEDFNDDLIILYAEDSATNTLYFEPEALEAAGIDRSELRALACENLERRLPKIECRGADGVYMVTAGGDYEASLLLLDSIWSSGQMDVQGDIVVAIPARGLLFVTGSECPEGLGKVRQIVGEAYDKGPYRLTPKLFVYRDGRFVEFEDGADPSLRP